VKRHYSSSYKDFERIYVFADGDQPGSDLGKKLAREVQGVIVINMPDGEDVNSIFNKQGTDFFREKVAA